MTEPIGSPDGSYGRASQGAPRSGSRPAALCAFAAFALAGCWDGGPNIERNFELDRFEGRWFEIARVPRDYDALCHDTVASYRRDAGDELFMRYTCRLGSPSGQEYAFEAVARPDDPQVPAKLSLDFGVHSGAYWVLDVDDDYESALIGHPSRLMLWLLSRKPELDPELRRRALERARAEGFDLDALRDTPRSGASIPRGENTP
jgi:apolipoprotein D and lipocalin family protein